MLIYLLVFPILQLVFLCIHSCLPFMTTIPIRYINSDCLFKTFLPVNTLSIMSTFTVSLPFHYGTSCCPRCLQFFCFLLYLYVCQYFHFLYAFTRISLPTGVLSYRHSKWLREIESELLQMQEICCCILLYKMILCGIFVY